MKIVNFLAYTSTATVFVDVAGHLKLLELCIALQMTRCTPQTFAVVAFSPST